MWATGGTINSSSNVLQMPSERHCKTPKRRSVMKVGKWLTELMMIVGFLMIWGAVGSYSNGTIEGLTFCAGVAIGIAIILVGFVTRLILKRR